MTQKTLSELFEEMESRAAHACTVMNNPASTDVEVKAAKKVAKSKEDAYNAQAEKDAYKAWQEEGNPVELAVKAYYLPGVKKIQYSVERKTGKHMFKISDTEIPVDLVELKKTCGAEVFHEEDWQNACENLAFLVGNVVDESLGKNPEFRVIVSESAKAFKFADNADPKSVKSMTKALQTVTDKILYHESKDSKGNPVNAIKMESDRWFYIRECLTSEGKSKGKLNFHGTQIIRLVAMQIGEVLNDTKNELVSM